MRGPIEGMSRADLMTWIEDMQSDLVEKKQREREAIDGQAQRGVHSINEVLLERDQILLQDLMLFLEYTKGKLESAVMYPVRTEG